jgi:hypothetical protein
MVQRIVTAKRDWSVSETSITLCDVTLAALEHQRPQALAYAATLLARHGTPLA